MVGRQLRRLDHRILYSRAKCITAHLLLPRGLYTSSEQLQLFNSYNSSSNASDEAGITTVNRSEFLGQYSSLIAYCGHKILGSARNPFKCYNLTWLQEFYRGKFIIDEDGYVGCRCSEEMRWLSLCV
jgi:hypothetical protein